MLTFQDKNTIRHAILKRLDDKKLGLAIADIIVKQADDKSIHVGVWIVLADIATADHIPDVRAFFDLPEQFRLRQVHNEIDEIAEGCKEAKRKAGIGRIVWQPGAEQKREPLKGTGLRGRWRKSDEVRTPVSPSIV